MGDTGGQTPTLLDAADALRLVSAFFEREWARTDLISRHNAAIIEPGAVLIRHFGLNGDAEDPPEDGVTLSAAQQALVHWEMNRKGWGPSLYGLFSGGRLEEYIDSHPLTAAESMQGTIRRDVARSYARFHSLRLPLRKDSFERVVQKLGQDSQSKHEQVRRELLAVEDSIAVEFATIFHDTDWTRELKWVSDLFEKHNCKITITHGDPNYLNILVKDFESDCRTVLIDYETVSYSYRGIDIGGHFNERMYCYNQVDSQLTGYGQPSIDEQRLFCEAYLSEMRDLGEAISEHDTVDHLILEASIGRLYSILFTNLMCTVLDEVEVDPIFLSGLVHMMKTYRQLKLEFVGSH
ncbi:hypothetical protein RBB50_002344 [Rhinocladiella similis]